LIPIDVLFEAIRFGQMYQALDRFSQISGHDVALVSLARAAAKLLTAATRPAKHIGVVGSLWGV